MEQFVILIIIGLISLINWLVQKSAEVREKRRLEQKIARGEAVEEEEIEPLEFERPTQESGAEADMRKFMEALGLPTEAPPPPPIVQRAEPTPPPIPVAELLPVAVRSERKIRRPSSEYVRLAKKMEAAEKEKSSAYAIEENPGRSPLYEALNLSSRESLRKAVVLREILGAPRCMEPLDFSKKS